MKIKALDFVAFFIPIAILVAFYGFNIHWAYVTFIGLPLSLIVYYLRIRSNSHKTTNINIIFTVIGIIIIISMYIYYNNKMM